MQLHPLNHNEHPSVRMYVQGYDPYAQLQVWRHFAQFPQHARPLPSIHYDLVWTHSQQPLLLFTQFSFLTPQHDERCAAAAG